MFFRVSRIFLFCCIKNYQFFCLFMKCEVNFFDVLDEKYYKILEEEWGL